MTKFEKKKTIITSYIYSSFNHHLLVYHFTSSESIRKTEKIQKKCLRITQKNFQSDHDSLQRKS